jgi:hypothetical protein
MYTLEELKEDRSLWRNLKLIPVSCNWCKEEFEIKYGTLYNIIRRDAEGVYCSRKHAGAARAKLTQDKYNREGGKTCKRCGEFKELDNFWPLPNPPYYRSECKRCRNYKPARRYSFYKDAAVSKGFAFDLTLNQFLEFQDKSCFYCDFKVENISLDLIDNTKGYIENNCISCCKRCKKFKGELEQEEFLKICASIVSNVKENGVEIWQEERKLQR